MALVMALDCQRVLDGVLKVAESSGKVQVQDGVDV